MEKIQEWIDNGADYALGLVLYKELPSCNKLLLRNFERKETPLNRQKLIYELNKFVKAPVQTVLGRNSPKKDNTPYPSVIASAQKEKATTTLFHQLPTELRPVLLEANNLFKENCLLKTELNELAAHQEAEALAIQLTIDSNFKANQLCWDKIEYWQKHKELPRSFDTPISKWSMDKLLKQQSLLQSSLSRMEKRLQENKVKMETATGKEYDRIFRAMTKQEKDILSKREELFHLKKEIDVKGAN